jgi:predicted transcriptional regulator
MIVDRDLKRILRLDLKELFLLYVLKHHGPIGRYRLVNVLNLPEGIVRGLLSRFQNKGYITASQKGSMLTDLGDKELIKRLAKLHISAIELFDGKYFNIGPTCVAIHIRNVKKQSRHGIKERDNAIKVGAMGAITLEFRNRNLIMPHLANISQENPIVAKLMMSHFNLKDNDVILIVFANNLWRAIEGGLFAASLK